MDSDSQQIMNEIDAVKRILVGAYTTKQDVLGELIRLVEKLLRKVNEIEKKLK